jgi:hypothetical protein
LGSLALLSTVEDDINISCDSLTLDIMKLLGIQNLPYLTFFLRSIKTNQVEVDSTENEQINNDQNSILTSHPLYSFILHSPSISFLSVWSVSQRCSTDNILYHMKQSFDLSSLLITRLKQIKTLQIHNVDDDDNNQETNNYNRICSGDAPNDLLPKPVVIFRFESNDKLEVSMLIK